MNVIVHRPFIKHVISKKGHELFLFSCPSTSVVTVRRVSVRCAPYFRKTCAGVQRVICWRALHFNVLNSCGCVLKTCGSTLRYATSTLIPAGVYWIAIKIILFNILFVKMFKRFRLREKEDLVDLVLCHQGAESEDDPDTPSLQSRPLYSPPPSIEEPTSPLSVHSPTHGEPISRSNSSESTNQVRPNGCCL